MLNKGRVSRQPRSIHFTAHQLEALLALINYAVTSGALRHLDVDGGVVKRAIEKLAKTASEVSS